VGAIQEPLTPSRNNGAQPEFAVDQRQVPEVFAIAPEQVEGVEPGLTTPEQQVFKLGFAMAVEAYDLAVEHR
jgi:hypothetical protein